jgi:hypothetical protein
MCGANPANAPAKVGELPELETTGLGVLAMGKRTLVRIPEITNRLAISGKRFPKGC